METKGKRSVFLSGENLREVPWGGGSFRASGGWEEQGLCQGPEAGGRLAPTRNRSRGSEAGLQERRGQQAEMRQRADSSRPCRLSGGAWA